MKLFVVTPEGAKITEDEIDEVVAPSVMGEIGVLPSHTPLLSALSIGRLIITKKGEKRYFALSKGYLEVADDNVIILAESCESAEEIDIESAENAKKRAIEALSTLAPIDGEAYNVKLGTLQIAETRLSVAKYKKNKLNPSSSG